MPGGSSRYIGGLLEYIVQTPWIAYIFLLLLVYCLLSAFIEKRKFLGVVQVFVLVCIGVVAVFRNTEGAGWEYVMIWVFGVVGCVAYWLERAIAKTPGI